ncbi:hypothetical protein [Dyella silvae]|uniref:hypothetical protein n=1 Tax=Dyella silvae TaxID=2994424 RepID=UPI002263D85E|nr:hypothetical protein [Dyella silvae]
MPSIIKFLERLGTDAQLRHASQEELAKALEESQVDAALGAAIIAHSTSADELYALLGLRPMFHTQENPGPWPLPPGVAGDVVEKEKQKASPAEQAAL